MKRIVGWEHLKPAVKLLGNLYLTALILASPDLSGKGCNLQLDEALISRNYLDSYPYHSSSSFNCDRWLSWFFILDSLFMSIWESKNSRVGTWWFVWTIITLSTYLLFHFVLHDSISGSTMCILRHCCDMHGSVELIYSSVVWHLHQSVVGLSKCWSWRHMPVLLSTQSLPEDNTLPFQIPLEEELLPGWGNYSRIIGHRCRWSERECCCFNIYSLCPMCVLVKRRCR